METLVLRGITPSETMGRPLVISSRDAALIAHDLEAFAAMLAAALFHDMADQAHHALVYAAQDCLTNPDNYTFEQIMKVYYWLVDAQIGANYPNDVLELLRQKITPATADQLHGHPFIDWERGDAITKLIEELVA